MNKEQATALLALIKAQPEAFAKACMDNAGEGDAEAFAGEIVTTLSEAAGTEEEENPDA